MNRHAPTRRIIAVMMLGLTVGVSACGQGTADKAGEEVAAGDYERGPNRGRMLRDGDFAPESGRSVHGDFRNALFYDWHAGRVDLKNEPK